MKNIIGFFLVLLFLLIFLPSSVSAYNVDNGWACAGIKGKFTHAENWSGGKVHVKCAGPRPGKLYCQGNEADVELGESFDFGDCNCFNSSCLDVTNVPDGCEVGFSSDRCSAANQNDIGLDFAVFCPKPEEQKPAETAAPRGRACECKFKESCTTDSGDEGERECNGVNKNNACEFDGDACPANCSECKAKNAPTEEKPTEENKPSEKNPTEENPKENPTPNPTEQPKNSPSPGSSPTASPSPKPSPAPSFSPAMCKCDGIESSLIFPGQSTSVTAFAKVEGKDLSGAEVKDMTFYLAKDSTVIAKSDPIGASIIEKTDSKIRYKSDWQFTLPNNVDKNAIYRVWTQQRCVKKQSVLGVTAANDQTNNKDFIFNIKSFFGNLFSSTSKYPSVQAPSQPGSNAAASSADTSNTTNNEKLQLQPLYPATVVPQTKDQSCRFLMFKFEK